MSWYSKVVWSEGLFLRPHHLQQADRYLENLLESRVRHLTPYPWGFAVLEIDRDLAQQSKIGLRRAAGVMPDGTPFALPDNSPLPAMRARGGHSHRWGAGLSAQGRRPHPALQLRDPVLELRHSYLIDLAELALDPLH